MDGSTELSSRTLQMKIGLEDWKWKFQTRTKNNWDRIAVGIGESSNRRKDLAAKIPAYNPGV